MKLSHILTPENILWELKTVERDSSLKEISDFLKETKVVEDSADIFEKLKAREEILSTGIGGGIAIPHCKSSQIESVNVAVARSKPGVQFDAVDHAPVHLFFIVISQPDQPNPHLQVLAKISRILRTPGSIHHFLNASSPEKLYAYIGQEEVKVT